MKLALISLSKEDEQSGFPIGLLPLFDSNIVDAQVRAALHAGAQKIILLSPAMPGPLLAFIDQLKRDAIDVEVVRTARDLGHYAAADDEILYIGDAVLWDKNFAKTLDSNDAERIFVTGNSSDTDDFELIDRNHRWLGIAKLKASRLAEIQDIPEDWDAGSALLRTAVQNQCHREEIAAEKLHAGAIWAYKNNESLVEYSSQRLSDPTYKRGNFLDRGLTWPIGRRLLPQLWKFAEAFNYLTLFAILLAVIAMFLAYFSWPIVALGAMILSVLSQKLGGYTRIFSQTRQPKWAMLPTCINMIALFTIFFVQSLPGVKLANIIICAVLVMLQIILHKEPENSRSDMFKPDILLVLLLLFIGAFVGQVALGLYAAILFSTVYLLYLRFPASRK